jgi:hypothetical protein
MPKLPKRRFAVIGVLLALLAGGAAVALGATGAGSPRPAGQVTPARSAKRAVRHASILSAAAGYLGIPTSQLRQELGSGRSLAQIADATSGRSASGLVAALLASRRTQLAAHVATLVDRPGGARGAARSGHRSARAAALAYLGLSRQQLGNRLRAGSSLAQIADAIPGKSSAGLIDAVVSEASKRLEGAVAGSHLKKGDAAARLARIRERVSALVERKRPAAQPAH